MSEILLVNPAKRKTRRRKKVSKKRRVRRRRNPSPPGRTRRRPRRSYKRNPSARAFSQRNLMDLGTAAVSGAAGAIGLDVALSFLPLPGNWKTGITGDITKAVGAIALGAVAKQTKLVKPATARDMTVGALTVQFTGIGRKLLAQVAPGVALSAYMNEDYEGALGYAGSGWNPSDALSWNGGMSAYNVGEGYEIAAPGNTQPGLGAYLDDYASAAVDGY